MLISFIGSGNVATHLAAAFKNAGHTIKQVWSLNPEHAAILAYHVKAEAISELNDLDKHSDIYIISIKDDAIAGISSSLRLTSQLLVHTSGSTGLEVLEGSSGNTGVFYPLQTFSKLKSVEIKQVPIAIEANSEKNRVLLENLAASISEKVIRLNSKQRLALHVAAVFASNFTNQLYAHAKQLLDQHKLDFGLLRPLILESAHKVMENFPGDVQTGPAVRNDISTMNKHLTFLETEPVLHDIYLEISQIIINFHQKHPG